MATKKTAADATDTGEDWKTMALTLVTTAIQQSGAHIMGLVHERVDAVVHGVVKRVVMLFLVLLGAAFVLLAAALALASLLPAWGLAGGFGIVGGILLLAALLMRFASR